MNAKYFFLFLCLPCAVWSDYYDNQKPRTIIQGRPTPPSEPIISSQNLRNQMADLDKQIQQLAGERESYRQKASEIKTEADAALSEYHRLLDAQRQYELDMQQRDDSIAELVRKKAEISRQIKG